jgi:hypothetical protein
MDQSPGVGGELLAADEVARYLERRTERPRTLVARLSAFLEMPVQGLAVAQDADLLARLDAAFLQPVRRPVGGRSSSTEPKTTSRPGSTTYRNNGLDATCMETMACLLRCPLAAPEEVSGVLRQVLAEAGDGRPLWVNINWMEANTFQTAMQKQSELAGLVATHRQLGADRPCQPST